jgi:hypothetical protein
MKMLLVLYTGDNLRFVPDILSACEGCSWTEFQGGIGMGHHHRHDGTRAFPGRTMMVLSILEDRQAMIVSEVLRHRGATLPESDHLHVAVLPVEQFA